MSSVPRIAVVGAGWWSTSSHLPSLASASNAELVGVVEPSDARRARATARFGVPGFPDLESLLSATNVDGVVVAVPHHLHHVVTAQALDAGMHVLLEKPMTVDVDEAWDLVRRSTQRRLHLMIGYTYQTTPLAARLKRALVNGEIGRILHMSVHSARPSRELFVPEAAKAQRGDDVLQADPATYSRPDTGGEARTELTHAVGLLCYATGLRPQTVYAQLNFADLPVDLAGAIVVGFETGVTAALSSTGSVQGTQSTEEWLRIYGDSGSIEMDLIAEELRIHVQGRPPEHHDLSQQNETLPVGWQVVRAFCEVLQGRMENPAPPVPAARAVQIIEGAHQSHRERRVVTVTGEPSGLAVDQNTVEDA